MIRCYITDRRALGGCDGLLRNIRRIGDAVDMIQVREKDLSARELAELVRNVIRVAQPRVRVLVNGRTDIALACGAHGVHLPANALSASLVRRIAPDSFLIGVSCHSIEDIRIAAVEQASFAFLAPIFQTPGKGVPLGLPVLAEAAQAVRIPVFALGGVDQRNIADCARAGAGGIAAIRLFQDHWSPPE